jgi:hypothetical protein
MILPGKHLSLDRSILGRGAVLLQMLNSPRTVSSLWTRAKERDEQATFDEFVLALVFLYSLGAVELKSGRLSRRSLA